MQIKIAIKYHRTPMRMATIQKPECLSARKDAKSTLNALSVECKMMQSRRYIWCLKNLKTELPYDLTIALLGTYPKELKAGSWRDMHPSMLTAEIFTIAQGWEWSTGPSTDKWMNQMWYRIKCGIDIQWMLLSLHWKKAVLIQAPIMMSLEDLC